MRVQTIGKIRRWYRVDKLSISKIARRLSASRNTIAPVPHVNVSLNVAAVQLWKATVLVSTATVIAVGIGVYKAPHPAAT